MTLDRELATAFALTREAGAEVLAMQRGTLNVEMKPGDEPVTLADRRGSEIIVGGLAKAFPDDPVISEEAPPPPGAQAGSRLWLVDPIDGTTNFMHAMPHFAITVGLERKHPDGSSEIVAGVTYNPVMNELFWAEKGKGCYLNDARIRVAGRKDLSESLIATGLPFIGKTGHAQAIKDIHAVGQRVAGIRRLGAASLDFAWVAAGRYDAYFERNLQPWDVAAGILLVTEAGGVVTTIDQDGDPMSGKQIVAGNPEIQAKLRKILREA